MTPAEGGWRMHGHMPAWGRVAFLGRPSIQRVGKNLQRCLPETRFLGSACWVAWILLVYSTEFLSPTADVHGYNALCYLVSTMAISLVYLGFGLSGAGGYRLISRRWPVLIAGAAASLGTAVIVAASYLPESFVALCVVGNVLTGAGTGVVSMRCACLYGELSARNAFMTAFCMMFVAMLIYGTTLTFPHVAAVAVTVLLPCAAALATMIDESSDATARSAGSRVLGPGFKRFVAVVFLLSFAFTISRGFYPNALQIGQFNESRGIVSLWCLVLCAVVVLVIAGLPDSLALGSLGFWIILVSALILAFIPLTGFYSPHIGVAFSTAFIMLGVVSWALFGALTSISGLSPLRVFGFGFLAYLLGSMIGWPLGQILSQQGMVLGGYGVAVFVALVLVVFFLLFRKRDLVSLLRPDDSSELDEDSGVPGVSSLAAQADACATCWRMTCPQVAAQARQNAERAASDGAGQDAVRQDGRPVGAEGHRDEADDGAGDLRKMRWRMVVGQLAQESGLTSREEEVLLLMAKARNARSISEELDISYNTARTHVRNIYTKLGVHSHAELVVLIEERRRQPLGE